MDTRSVRMISNGILHQEKNGHLDEYPLNYMLNGERHPVINNNPSEISKWARDAVELVGTGELEKALHFMNLCLEETFRTKIFTENVNSAERQMNLQKPINPVHEGYKLSDSDEVILLEKRCYVQMKLKLYDKVWEGASRIIAKRPNHTVAFKFILASLCKTDKFSLATDVLNLWKMCAPNDLDMIEARTKVEGLMNAVRNGIEPSNAFSNIEEVLGLYAEWMVGRGIYEPQWKYRLVPPGANSFVLCLQYRFGHCSLNDKCPDAHGEQELEEWKLRYSISNLSTMLACSTLDREATYVKRIMDALSQLVDEKSFLTEELPGITVSCSETLRAQLQSSTMKSHSWEFKVHASRPLCYICLLYEVHRPYFKIGSAVFNGLTNTLNLKTGKLASESLLQVLEVSVNPAAMALAGSLPDSYNYSVEVICTPDVFGTFRQTILFDFGGDPKLIREITVDVVPPAEEDSESETVNTKQKVKADKKLHSFASNLKTRSTWNFGNADIVDSTTGERVKSERVGFALMTSPTLKRREVGISNSNTDYQYLLNKENYKERMRFFLTQEERARQVILSKYNISAHVSLAQNYDMSGGYNEGTRYAVSGSLFGRMVLFRDISEDTPVGRLILRSCNLVLLAKTEKIKKNETTETRPRVYLCQIAEKTKNAMFFELGSFCVNELRLNVSEVTSFDIQFQLDRTAFMEQKKVIDQITDMHLDILFPDFSKEFRIPWNTLMQWHPSVESKSIRLNAKQKEAFNAVTTKATRTPPILIIGPFGTGKTFTLFQCIKRILEDENSRIMICTHSNSAADLYIKEYLDPMVKAGNEHARPLRIYYALRSKLTVHKEIRPYCLYTDSNYFRSPTKEEVLQHRIIVVTLSTSFMLIDLKLPSDTFSHILLDEAAQAMESEAITPLLAAGENTKLVLAGDHMQLSPELFSEDAKHFHSSLLERLHCAYPDSHPCKLMLCENYRSHSAIIKFASDSFYKNKLECGMVQPIHNDFYPLTFFAARGEDIQDADSTSYYNMAEVFEVSKRVIELISSWPEKWGDWKKDNQIGVLTPYPDQVNRIRQNLRKKGFYTVSVERVLNVQGKQFRAVFLSTVRTHKPWVRILPEAVGNEVDMGFFSNPKLLNTALTRAQSLVVVVGDPVSLCSLGKCRRLWEDFVNTCDENKSLHGMTFTQIKQNIVGLEMRLTWGLNPLANEYVPRPSDSTSLTTPAPFELELRKVPLLPLPTTLAAVTTVSDSTYNRISFVHASNSGTRFNNSLPPQGMWPNMNLQNLSSNCNQFHPQNQMPVPMIPVPILMNPPPAFNPGVPPQPYSTSFPVMQRPPLGYPPMGPRYIAVPIHHRAASAFAQYRPMPPPPPPLRPPTMSLGSAHPGMGYPSPILPPPKVPQPHHSPAISQGQGNTLGPPISTSATEKNIWGQPLYRTNEYNVSSSHLSMDHSQNNFQQNNWPSLTISHSHQRPPGPITTNTNTNLNPYRNQPHQQFQSQAAYQQAQQQKPLSTWMPLSSQTLPVSTVGNTASNPKFSQQELMYLQRVMGEYTNSAHPQPKDAIHSIQEKLTQAVSGLNEPHVQFSNPDFLRANTQQQHSGGLAFNNSHHILQQHTTNPLSGVSLSHQTNHNFGSYTQHPPSYQQCETSLGNPHLPVQYNCSNMASEMSSLQISSRGSNQWSGATSSQQGMNGVMANGFPTPASNSHGTNHHASTGTVPALKSEMNKELTVGWLRPHSASTPTNIVYNMQSDLQMTNQSSSSGFGRSYASAVKKPVTQPTSNSPTTFVESDPVVERTKERKCQRSQAQPKPLMEMDVEFPFPPQSYSPPLRIRGNNNSPPPRFRVNMKKGKKKK